MISFLNDYNEVSHPKILDELQKYQNEKFEGYSKDELVQEAISNIKDNLQNHDVEIHFLHGGTIANVIGLMMTMQRHESVISVDTGHIVNTENASIEAIGHQIVLVKEKNGKMTVEEIEKALNSHSYEYNSKPKVVYISNATELGTVYKRDELKKLYEYCKSRNLYLFMDGARIANAIMSKHSDLEFSDLPKYLDVFTIGGTKNGFMFGEAVVFVNEELKNIYARMVIKQRGALLAKGFLYGIQFKTMFENGLFFKIAKNAVDMAQKLVYVFEKYNISTVYNTEANLVFVELDNQIHDKLSEKFMYQYDAIDENKGLCRFVTTWNTNESEIVELDRVLEKIIY
ncbi:aminotransferase class I/II-fold pyridoxal phosphate-dependent enzyme [Helcococcus ovis]|uniref:Aminotransferase class I/II-fold pyridoxal phosphate-dependent enzyme n=3 Tax=Helcococcus ovis TaxID=72026 RepID=A0A4R9C3A6_9FIRM|nr:aminotransferase class I/II-fold pyridoxal phosphate-dependent enzyme [Helcococcus ovis]TFF64501.1 aminotransferase class I/II-fold pyridoxal phosphate-dependent enzyme [Helcococcus ovis]TFF66606.1 aminotransferase class I/II-fold pyridoxal phosphate-dependent enzyme [Helcococcus ovis]TFF66662.1 aminotransferase class I/II-fold pyridoxal phosphate-dependent enzyme [Helcococcus ovis]WNZ01100.1 aminotransferase class I/II-fold pyridoxal phosphate-dependent enzyme [Helcococcus ovis]